MKITQELLERYHRQRCTAQEIEAVDKWLSDDITNTIYRQVEKEDEHLSDVWQKLSTQVNTTQVKPKKLYMWPLSIAASIVLLLSLGLVFYGNIKQLFVERLTLSHTNGEPKSLILADNSTIHFNSGSTLQYPSFFGGNTREVTLTKGEAFFEIAKDPDHPFIVHTGQVDITVLGTKFNIKNDPQGSEIEITLVEGKIKFSTDQKQHILLPNQQITYNKNTGAITLNHKVNSNKIMAWTTGILWFEDTPLPEVFQVLEYKYGVRFKIEKEVNIPFTAKFKKEPLEKILQLIELSTDIKFKKNQENITAY